MKTEPDAVAIADRHYSRQTPGSNQFTRPGQNVVLMTWRHDAIFAWWRPDPASGVRRMDGRNGWECTLFRNEGRELSSRLILDAERTLLQLHGVGPDGFLTFVDGRKVRSTNPGYCFQVAGWVPIGWSKKGGKRLLQKSQAAILRDHRPDA